MINWSKFISPSNNDLIHYSDLVYPLTRTSIKTLDKFDHVNRLLSSDILANAEDRRFALSQRSTAGAYDFQSSKLEQIEGAIETLDRYIEQRRGAYSPVVSTSCDGGIKQDLAGMSRYPTQLSDFRISPPPMGSSSAENHKGPSQTLSPSVTTTATTASYSRPSSVAASTAATSSGITRVSIADLLNTQPASQTRSHPEDLPVDSSPQSLSPEELNATLDTIRSSRGISRPSSAEEAGWQEQRHLNLASYSNHHENGAQSQYRGRAYRAARMRRSSQTRQKRKSPHANMSTPPLPDRDETTSLPASPHSMPEIGSPLLQSKPPRYGPAHFQEWFDNMLGRRTSNSDVDEFNKAIQRASSGPQSARINYRTSRSRSGSPALPMPQLPLDRDFLTDSTVENKAVSEPDTQAYAYATDSRQTPYGYIAGDARDEPGRDEHGSRVRIRGRARERGRGPRVRVGSRFRLMDLQKSPTGASNSNSDVLAALPSKSASDPGPSPATPRRVHSPHNHHQPHHIRQSLPLTSILAPATIEVDPLLVNANTLSTLQAPRRSHHFEDSTVRKRRKTHNRSDSSQDLRTLLHRRDVEHDAAQLAEIEAAKALAEKWWKDPLELVGS